MREADIMRTIQLEATKLGCRLFRNNVGRLHDKDGRYVQYGLCRGSSDLIGWTKGGRFLAVEVKGPKGKLTKNQGQFLDAVNQEGGIGIVVSSVDEFRLAMQSKMLH